MKSALALASAVAGAACVTSASPELACQQRLAAAARAIPPESGSFGAEAYARMDRSGCTAKQLAALDRLTVLTRELPDLSAANELAAKNGDTAAHGSAFQRMNDAVIELNEIQNGVSNDLEQMEPPQ